MNRDFIFKRNNPQITASDLRDCCPKSESVVFLWFNMNSILNNINAPLLFQIRAFLQDLLLKLLCEFVRCHSLISVMSSGPEFGTTRQENQE